ncbi:MAG: hypothetical protein OHK0015_04370 [Chloroflexi bacterium OHK40]
MPTTWVDTITLGDGLAGASQSCAVPAAAAALPLRWLVALGQGYHAWLGRLTFLAVAPRQSGGACVGLWPAPARLRLLCFGPPYLAAARGGRELRYPIVGGLMARGPGGYLAFGVAAEGVGARLWADVVGYRPRLGLGPLYTLTQARFHAVITVCYLRRVVAANGW